MREDLVAFALFALIAVVVFSAGLWLGAATGTFYGWTP